MILIFNRLLEVVKVHAGAKFDLCRQAEAPPICNMSHTGVDPQWRHAPSGLGGGFTLLWRCLM